MKLRMWRSAAAARSQTRPREPKIKGDSERGNMATSKFNEF